MKALLIPSAVLVPQNMRERMGGIPAALYPLGNMTMLERLREKYAQIADKIYIAAYEGREYLEDFIAMKGFDNVHVIELDVLRDLGYTIQFSIEKILEGESGEVEQLFINFADTLVSNIHNAEGDAIFYSILSYGENWTYFERLNDTVVISYDKSTTAVAMGGQGNAIVGIFSVMHPALFLEKLREEKTSAEVDSFYSALESYSRDVDIELIIASQWTDVGHSENYLKARTGVEARSFNSIEIDEERGILTKRSSEKDKFINEINWYLNIPRELQYLIPRVYDFSTDWDAPYISMEYYGYNTLHELLLYGKLPAAKWVAVFERLNFAIDDMASFKPTRMESSMLAAVKDIYIAKTEDRLNTLRKNERFTPFFTSNITVNGEKFLPLDYYIELIPDMIYKYVLKSELDFQIIHGDLCFSNILVEPTCGFIRLVDPRGKFGSFDIYGDIRYDFAKLLHSLEGCYDHIIEDMFKIRVIGTCIDFEIFNRPANLLGLFREVFSEKLTDIDAVRLIESMLFLSMIPLHGDSLSRQYAMLATGLSLLDDVLKGGA